MKRSLVLLLFFALASAAHAQYVALGAGGVFNRGSVSSNEITTPGIIAVEGGLPISKLLDGAVHYSFANPRIQQDSRYAPQDLPTHTLTFDARIHTPQLSGWRVFGLAGVGFAHFSSPGTSAVGPFSRTQPVFDYGGGVERKIAGPFKVRAEVRDYFTSAFYTGSSWNRIAVTGSLVFGK